QQYEGWPVTIDQMDNYGREAIAYLPEINVSGMEDPVVQVIYERTGEIAYTLRIDGSQFKPKVFKDGKYTVKVGEQPDNMKTYTGLDAQEDEEQEQVLNVEF
ncbi:MAG: hypothetical protein KGY70_20205, partial [Bacteroidales bacterium]|nr:hypothetical protein [Bacteroidales bacterium]